VKLLFDQHPASSISPIYDHSEFLPPCPGDLGLENLAGESSRKWVKRGRGTYLVEKTFHSFAVMNPLLF